MVETHTVRKMNASTLLVETGQNVLQPFESNAEILRIIGKALAETSDLNVEFQNYDLTLSADQAQIPGMKPSQFRLERKKGIEFTCNRFHSVEPLRTTQQLDILERLEQLASP